MIVDDDRTTAMLLQTLLSIDGFEVCLVGRGKEVLARARQEHPDIFLIDYHLADSEGPEVVRNLRQDPEFAVAPIVIASGMNVEEEATAAGASLFLIKPLDPGDLASILHSLLQASARQASADHNPSSP
jgi:chemosensory pili system protein ChpA (sensor histidine kinase/response regulator)